MQLFAERAHRAEFAFVLSAENIGPVIEICRCLEGIPLSIEMAATWIRQMPPATIAATIINDLNRLAIDMQDVTERHRSIHAVFSGSWRLLTPVEQRVLMQATVFRGGFEQQYDQMLSHAERGLYLATKRRDRSFEGTIKSVIGGIHSDRGEYGRAIRNFKEDLAIHEEIQGTWAQNIAQLNLALYWIGSGGAGSRQAGPG